MNQLNSMLPSRPDYQLVREGVGGERNEYLDLSLFVVDVRSS